MAVEIERKFIVDQTRWSPLTRGFAYEQGYLTIGPELNVRVRIVGNAEAFLTLKQGSSGIARHEFEYAIPVEDAQIMLGLCGTRRINKTRYKEPFGEKIWDVDVFSDANEGLVLAEIELDSTDQQFELPDWILREVTGKKKYYNAYLSQYPYVSWLTKV
jgi:adenylate cyclase